jgi:hypothetical protein
MRVHLEYKEKSLYTFSTEEEGSPQEFYNYKDLATTEMDKKK